MVIFFYWSQKKAEAMKIRSLVEENKRHKRQWTIKKESLETHSKKSAEKSKQSNKIENTINQFE